MIRQYLSERTSFAFPFLLGAHAAATGGASLNSTAVDSTAHPFAEDGLTVVKVNTPTGAPDSFAVVVKLQDASAGGSDWADIAGATATLTAAGQAEIPFSTNAIRPQRRWNCDISFVNGTAPKVDVVVAEVLGRAKKEPLA